MYATKQKTSLNLPLDTFSGLKIAAKYVCGRGFARTPLRGVYSAPPDLLAALGEGRRRGKQGREGEDRKGEKMGQGRAGERRGRYEGRGREEAKECRHFLGQVYAPV